MPKTYSAIGYPEGKLESTSLARVVHFVASKEGGIVIDDRTGQQVRIDMSTSPVSIEHAKHPNVKDLDRKNERPFLMLVGKYVQRYTRKPVLVEDSWGREMKFGGLVDKEFERFRDLPRSTVLEINRGEWFFLDAYEPIKAKNVGDRFSVGEAIDPSSMRVAGPLEEVGIRKNIAKKLRDGELRIVEETAK